MIAPAPNHDSDREEFSGRAVVTSTTAASASGRGSPEDDDCQKTADVLSFLSITKVCLKAVIDYLVQQKVPKTLVSEIVRASPEAALLMWPSVPSSLPRSLRTVEMDSLRRQIVTLTDSFNLCQAVKSGKGTGSDKRLRIVTAMLGQVFCGAQGATLAFVTTATMLADALTLVDCPLLLAAMNARRHVFVISDSSTGVKTTLPMLSELMPTLKMAIGSQLIRSAESHSGSSGPCTD